MEIQLKTLRINFRFQIPKAIFESWIFKKIRPHKRPVEMENSIQNAEGQLLIPDPQGDLWAVIFQEPPSKCHKLGS